MFLQSCSWTWDSMACLAFHALEIPCSVLSWLAIWPRSQGIEPIKCPLPIPFLLTSLNTWDPRIICLNDIHLLQGARLSFLGLAPPKGRLLYWHSSLFSLRMFYSWREVGRVWTRGLRCSQVVQDEAGVGEKGARVLTGTTSPGTAMFLRRTLKSPNILTWTLSFRWLGRCIYQGKW